MKYLALILSLGLLMVFTSSALGDDRAPSERGETAKNTDVFVTINGTPLSMDLYRFLLGSRDQERAERQHYDDSFDADMHRAQVAEDLVMTEVLAQQATRSGMHKNDAVKAEMAMAEKTLLAQLYVQKLMDSIEVDESEIRRYYDQKIEQTLYRFMIWQTSNQDRATEVLNTLKAGDGAGVPAEDVIETPWLRDTDIAPDVNKSVRRLQVSEFVEKPVFQDDLWKVVQVIDKQVMTKQSYDEEKSVIRAELVSMKLDQKLEKLAEDASIVFNARQ
jgi:hypothetical protein